MSPGPLAGKIYRFGRTWELVMASNERQRSHSGLACSKCGGRRIGVVDSRIHNGTVRRRRRCMDCGFRVTTYEVTAFERRLIDAWAERIHEVRDLAHKLAQGLDAIEGRVESAAKEDISMRDMTPRSRGSPE